MQKKQVLVRDKNGIFLKMFKRKFKEKIEFSEDTLFDKKDAGNFDQLVYVIYDKLELLDFIKLYPEEKNVLVCLFDKNFYKSLVFLEKYKSLILFDESKTRNEIFIELKYHFESSFEDNSVKENQPVFNSGLSKKASQDYYKALFFLM